MSGLARTARDCQLDRESLDPKASIRGRRKAARIHRVSLETRGNRNTSSTIDLRVCRLSLETISESDQQEFGNVTY